jgi:hypothetical protein
VGAWVAKVSDGSHIVENAPYPSAHWDNADNDLLWVVGGHNQINPTNLIEQWRPSTGAYTTWIDYTGRFQTITTGQATDMTYDNWVAFWAPAEHNVCAVDLMAKKTYCVDVNVPDPVNHLPSVTPAVHHCSKPAVQSDENKHSNVIVRPPVRTLIFSTACSILAEAS